MFVDTKNDAESGIPNGAAGEVAPTYHSPLDVVWRVMGTRKRTPTKPPSTPASSIDSPRETSPLLNTPASEDPTEPTVYYLAYGSNLSASTFLGRRGISPLSSLPVYVPGYVLVFDLPGVPYWEPCFGNLKRLHHGDEEGPVGAAKAAASDLNIDASELMTRIEQTMNDEAKDKEMWDSSLIGVVYEVTQSDYATIIKTEGGGQTYRDVEVPCFVLPGAKSEYGSPRTADDNGIEEEDAASSSSGLISPRVITAHTLLAPPSVTHRSNVQPSPRYLNLLITGSKEHNLPPAYVQHLKTLHAYHRTTWRQTIGGSILLGASLPWIIAVWKLAQLLSDKSTGKTPKWIGKINEGIFSGMWLAHDAFFRWVFGSGAQTIGDEGKNVLRESWETGERDLGFTVGEADMKDAIVSMEEAVVDSSLDSLH